MSDEETVNDRSAEPVRGPSAVLVEAREKLGLSQKDVADRLFLTTTFIRYIDAGEFERIPKPAFVKGYLRTYARTVGLSGDLIVELYEKELQAADPTPEIKGVTEEDVGTASITGPVLQTGLIGLMLLGFVVAIVWWVTSDGEEDAMPRVTQPSLEAQPIESKPTETAADDVVTPDSTEQALATGATPVAQGAAQLQFDDTDEEVISSAALESNRAGDAEDEAAADSDESVEAPLISDASDLQATEETPALDVQETADEPEEINIERNSDGDRRFITVDAQGFDQVELSFTDECWVEIRDDKHGLVYNDLNRADDVLTIYGTAPYEVLLGKASGVEMIYNGRPFNLEPYIGRDRTAKLTIDRQ